MITEDEIRRFMRERFPKYADNLVLGRLLYAKYMGTSARALIADDYEKVKIKWITPDKEGKKVEVVGLVGSIQKYVYEACAVCMKKDCEEHNGRVQRQLNTLLVGDETDTIEVDYFGDLDAEVGDEVVVRGRVKLWKGDPEILADAIFKVGGGGITEDERIGKVLEFVKKAVKVKRDILQKYCEKIGISYDDVVKRKEVVVRGEYIEWGGEDGGNKK